MRVLKFLKVLFSSYWTVSTLKRIAVYDIALAYNKYPVIHSSNIHWMFIMYWAFAVLRFWRIEGGGDKKPCPQVSPGVIALPEDII